MPNEVLEAFSVIMHDKEISLKCSSENIIEFILYFETFFSYTFNMFFCRNPEAN